MALSLLAEKLPDGSPYPFVGASTFSSSSAVERCAGWQELMVAFACHSLMAEIN